MTNVETYLQYLAETTVKGAKSPEDLNKDLTTSIEPLSVKSIDGAEEPDEAPDHLQGENVSHDKNKEGTKYNIMNKDNAFDRLYKHAINEDFDEMDSAESPGFDSPGGLGGEEDFGGGEEDFGGDIDSEEGHVGKVREVIDLLQQALDKLSAFEGEEEEEYEEYEGGEDMEGLGGEDLSSEEPVTEEEVDAETLGHAIVDVEKLKKGMDKPGNMKVTGAVPNVGKKAQAPAGQKNDGKLSNFSDSGGKKLQGKGNMKVAGRASNVNKTIFDS